MTRLFGIPCGIKKFHIVLIGMLNMVRFTQPYIYAFTNFTVVNLYHSLPSFLARSYHTVGVCFECPHLVQVIVFVLQVLILLIYFLLTRICVSLPSSIFVALPYSFLYQDINIVFLMFWEFFLKSSCSRNRLWPFIARMTMPKVASVS